MTLPVTLDQHIDGLRSAVKTEISRALDDFIQAATKVRASREALDDACKTFADHPSAVEFLKSLAPAPLSRAQHFARVRVAEIQLYHAAAMRNGRNARDVYGALKAQMDAAREAYREKFLTPVNGTADELHVEFVRTLANDDATLLGPDYPGPLA
jgi:hypothetical protein